MKIVHLLFTLAAAAGSLADEALRVELDRFGPVQVGMTAESLADALRAPVIAPTDPDAASCWRVDDPHHRNVSFMVSNGHVARIDVFAPGVLTARGAGVGDSAERIRALYGPRLEDTPHFYTGPEGRYLTFWSGNRRFAVRFEVEGGKVVRYYAGRMPEVEFVEGCE